MLVADLQNYFLLGAADSHRHEHQGFAQCVDISLAQAFPYVIAQMNQEHVGNSVHGQPELISIELLGT